MNDRSSSVSWCCDQRIKMIVFLSLLASAALVVYLYLKYLFNYWARRGVPSPPVNLLFGNLTEAMTLKKALGQIATDLYKKYENYAYVGFYKVHKPAILVRDLELIKSVLFRDSSSFLDNDFHVSEKSDFIMGKNPFVLKGQRWRTVRSQLTPGFTVKKIKSMFPLLQETGAKMVKYLDERIAAGDNEGLNAKELMSKFTTENVASCVFGLDANCFGDENAEFRVIGRKFLTPSFWLGIQHLLIMAFPSLACVLNVKFFPLDIAKRFANLVSETLEYRKENGIIRNDYLDFLKELKAKHVEMTNDDIVAHAAGFYADGFETSSITLSFITYEIASNLHVQNRLREEIDDVTGRHDGKFTYEAIQEMEYLDCVFWEGVRKHPVVHMLQRLCTKEHTFPSPLPNGSGPEVKIQPGTSVWIPTTAIQSDAKYFPNPEVFDPDRFSSANKGNIIKGTILGFGEGPRICLGQNFGIAQTKLGIAVLVRNYELRVNKKTRSPLELDARYFMRAALGGIWLDFHRRKV